MLLPTDPFPGLLSRVGRGSSPILKAYPALDTSKTTPCLTRLPHLSQRSVWQRNFPPRAGDDRWKRVPGVAKPWAIFAGERFPDGQRHREGSKYSCDLFSGTPMAGACISFCVRVLCFQRLISSARFFHSSRLSAPSDFSLISCVVSKDAPRSSVVS